LLEQTVTDRVPLLKATSTFRFGRRRYISPKLCYLRCLCTLQCAGNEMSTSELFWSHEFVAGVATPCTVLCYVIESAQCSVYDVWLTADHDLTGQIVWPAAQVRLVTCRLR